LQADKSIDVLPKKMWEALIQMKAVVSTVKTVWDYPCSELHKKQHESKLFRAK